MPEEKTSIRSALIGAGAAILVACIGYLGVMKSAKKPPEPAVVTGRVTDLEGNAIAKAVVKVDEPGTSLQSITDDNGEYSLVIESEDLKRASQFIASAKGYTPFRNTLAPVPPKAKLLFALPRSGPLSQTPAEISPVVRKLLQSYPPTIDVLKTALGEFKRASSKPRACCSQLAFS